MDARELVHLPTDQLCAEARRLRPQGLVTYSPKVFIPLTTLCRDVCGYCTFARPPRRGERAFLSEDEVLAIARAGAAAGCHEALFTLGDKPELRYRSRARSWPRSAARRRSSTWPARRGLVLDETGLLPHLNPGVMSRDELVALRAGQRLDGDHARDARPSDSRRTAGRTTARRTSCPRAGSRRSPRRRARDPVHDRDPDRDRRDARGAARRAARDPRARRALRPHPGGDRPELPREAGHAHGRPPRARRSTTTSGRSRPRASCSARTATSRRRRTSHTTTSPGCSTPGSTTGAASRR